MHLKRLLRFLRPQSDTIHSKQMGMDFISPVGINLEGRLGGIFQIPYLLDSAYSFATTDIPEIATGIEILKKIPRETNIIAHLNKKRNTFNGEPKSLEASFALLYDFVDAFIISGLGSIEDEINPLLDLRLFQNEYRPIILEIPNDYGTIELEEVIAYAMLNSIDGLMIRNQRLIEYASRKSKGYLCIIASGIDNKESMEDAMNAGASLVAVEHKHKRAIALSRIGKRLIKELILKRS